MKKDTNPPISRNFEEIEWEANDRGRKNETQLYDPRDVFDGGYKLSIWVWTIEQLAFDLIVINTSKLTLTKIIE